MRGITSARARRAVTVAVGAAILAASGARSAAPLSPTGATGANAASVRAQPAIEVHSAHGASFVPALQGRRPLFILVLGSDVRPSGSRVAGQRADSIHILGVDRARRRATLLGFPRDSLVYIPGFGTRKINDALNFGGPDLMVRTVERLTSIRIDFWAMTTFPSFVRLVDGLGGLTVNVPYDMHDPYSGADFRAGPRKLSGRQALAFARNRHDTPDGDFSRSQNQGRLLLAALAKLRVEFGHDPTALLRWVSVGWHNVRTNLEVPTLLNLGMAAAQIPASNVTNLVVPGRGGSAGGASVVFLSPSARSVFADLRRDGFVAAR